jgi:hypothetical protein
MSRYHNYELASASHQIGIVLASAAVITGTVALAYAAGGLGLIGLVLTGIGLFAPELPHDALHGLLQMLGLGGGALPAH